MEIIAFPSTGPRDWQHVLAKPDLHWRSGASVMTLASCWEAANGDFPPEIRRALNSSPFEELSSIAPLLIIPEYGIPLPGGTRPSMTDVFVLAKGDRGLVTLAVEGKVNEPFGPLVGEKRQNASSGQLERLRFLKDILELSVLPDELRYQLLHRTASAILAANQFGANISVMLVHSFSRTLNWFGDFEFMMRLYGMEVQPNKIYQVPRTLSPNLYVGWCCGDQTHTMIDLSKVE